MPGREVVRPRPALGSDTAPAQAGGDMSSSGKSASAVSLCRDLGLGRRGCSPVHSGLAPAGEGQGQPP